MQILTQQDWVGAGDRACLTNFQAGLKLWARDTLGGALANISYQGEFLSTENPVSDPALNGLYALSHQIFATAPEDMYCDSHFTDEQAEAQRRQMTFQRLHSSKWQKQDF